MSSRAFNAIATISSLPALLAASWFYYPRVFDGPTICLTKLILGMPCFGCGLTRAFCSMVHGDFVRMLVYHPLAPVVLVWMGVWWIREVVALARGVRAIPVAWFTRCTTALGCLFFVLWGARMTVFFASADGYRSLLTKNLYARILRWDWSNTHEPFVLDSEKPRG